MKLVELLLPSGLVFFVELVGGTRGLSWEDWYGLVKPWRRMTEAFVEMFIGVCSLLFF